MEAAATAKETTSNLKIKNFRCDNDMVQHLIDSLLENKRLMTCKIQISIQTSLCNIKNYEQYGDKEFGEIYGVNSATRSSKSAFVMRKFLTCGNINW